MKQVAVYPARPDEARLREERRVRRGFSVPPGKDRRGTRQVPPLSLVLESAPLPLALEKGIRAPMAQGRSTNILSMIKWIRTSRLSTKTSLPGRSNTLRKAGSRTRT